VFTYYLGWLDFGLHMCGLLGWWSCDFYLKSWFGVQNVCFGKKNFYFFSCPGIGF
jgi:hypothetical protein